MSTTETPRLPKRLYSYYRSSCAYRVRIALAYKGLPIEQVTINLRDGEQRHKGYLELNPQGLVPALQITSDNEEQGNNLLTQSLAIIEYLDEQYPSKALLPGEPQARAKVRAVAYQLAMDIQPLNNLRVLHHLEQSVQLSKEQQQDWYHYWIHHGFKALEATLKQQSQGDYCFGNTITLADVCLIPQVYNAQRFACDLSNYPRISEIYTACTQRVDFQQAAPEQQPDVPH